MSRRTPGTTRTPHSFRTRRSSDLRPQLHQPHGDDVHGGGPLLVDAGGGALPQRAGHEPSAGAIRGRSEEHTSELQSLMLISYAVFCLKIKNIKSCLTLRTLVVMSRKKAYILTNISIDCYNI